MEKDTETNHHRNSRGKHAEKRDLHISIGIASAVFNRRLIVQNWQSVEKISVEIAKRSLFPEDR